MPSGSRLQKRVLCHKEARALKLLPAPKYILATGKQEQNHHSQQALSRENYRQRNLLKNSGSKCKLTFPRPCQPAVSNGGHITPPSPNLPESRVLSPCQTRQMPLHNAVCWGLLDRGPEAPVCYSGFPEKCCFHVYLEPAVYLDSTDPAAELGTKSQNRMRPASPSCEFYQFIGRKTMARSQSP